MDSEFAEDSEFNNISGKGGKIAQEQLHRLLFSDSLSWQGIIYDLINTEQLDPWDVDISMLAMRFFDKVRELEEANFFVSSKVLFAAALLLRMKSEVLLERDIAGLDSILFGKKEGKTYAQQRIELDEEIPELGIRTPLPRFKRVTLNELMEALGKAINTETRRIKKIGIMKQYETEIAIALPKHRINIRDKIREIYSRLKEIFSEKEDKLALSDLVGKSNEEKVAAFVPLLHLEHQNKVWLGQDAHFDEIWILLKSVYEKQNKEELERMRKEVEEFLSSQKLTEKENRARKIEEEFSEPLGEIL